MQMEVATAMEVQGTHRLSKSPQQVWNALHDAGILQRSISGVDEVEWQGDSAIRVKGIAKLGPINREFAATLPVTESSAPNHVRINVKAPTTQGALTVDLTPEGSGTIVSYSVDVALSGALAIADNPIVRGLVNQQVDQFFLALEKQIG